MDRLSVAQAATVLGVTQAAVYKRIQRCIVEHDKDAEDRVFHSRRVSLIAETLLQKKWEASSAATLQTTSGATGQANKQKG